MKLNMDGPAYFCLGVVMAATLAGAAVSQTLNHAGPPPSTASVGYRAETVKSVVDGDTFSLTSTWSDFRNLEFYVRVQGIDTPEKGVLARCDAERVTAERATLYALQLLPSGTKIRLSGVTWDKYGGRIDASVQYLDPATKRYVSYESALLASNLARVYTGVGPKPDWCGTPGPQ